MKGDKQINLKLNGVLKHLLTGINQYFLHSGICQNWGFDDFRKHDYKYSIYLMKAADKIMQRILFLEGLPNLQDLGKLYIGQDIPEIIAGNMRFDTEMRETLLDCIRLCEAQNDFISREHLASILDECEEQIDWLESQQHLIKTTGLENYLQSAV